MAMLSIFADARRLRRRPPKGLWIQFFNSDTRLEFFANHILYILSQFVDAVHTTILIDQGRRI